MNLLLAAVGFVLLGAFVVLAYWRHWQWTGLPAAHSAKGTGDDRPAKTLWDWLQLLGIPVALAALAFFLNDSQSRRDQKREDRRAAQQLVTAQDVERENTLRIYLAQMSDLMLSRRLLHSKRKADVREVARTATLTAVRRLDPERRGLVVRFLAEARLLHPIGSPRVRIASADLTRTDLNGADLDAADLRGADLRSSDLRTAFLYQANLSHADLRGARFHGAYLTEAHLAGADLRRVDFHGVRLNGAHLSGATLTGANLTRAHLRHATFHGAFLRGANLRRAHLSAANLVRADLTGADLRGANLRGAFLRDANLRGANLRGANLTRAYLGGADLRGAHGAEIRGSRGEPSRMP